MSTIRILAIEDDPVYAEALRLVIEELNYLLIEVVSEPQEFLRSAKATIPDLFLIDIDLAASMDGIELAKQVSLFSSAPVIFLTAYQDRETILRATEAKPSAYLTKPYEAASLQAAIEIAVSGRAESSKTFEPVVQQQSMFVKSDGRIKKLIIGEILFIEVKEKYCHIKLTDEDVIINMRLKDLMDILPGESILQVHRSFAVMKDHITDIDSDYSKLRIGKIEIPVGNNYRKYLIDMIKLR
ncbi:MAG: LytR/AlgR family response regulator transcription factor [Cyclobacteriaceae bacterium]